MSYVTLQQVYTNDVIPTLKKELGQANIMSLPRITKVVVNVGTGKIRKDKQFMAQVTEDITAITGQKPAIAKAKKSIAGFSLREGENVGLRVTLRGKRMYEFLDRLIHIALPRTRDFRGLKPTSIDRQGNISIGIKEHFAFPEIAQDKSERIFGFQITVTTTAQTKEEGETLFKALKFPINWNKDNEN